MKTSPEASLISYSTYYSFWRQELTEINKLKWIESEKAGSDIGIEKARALWNERYRAGWAALMRASGMYY